ncbi:MAG: 4-hydroxy-tetrahydrodipicolinate reductase [Clostridia bacterium]|nr:4-hydroxy-tetrahydrodipicolinate reductase [Clostridia bacterium]
MGLKILLSGALGRMGRAVAAQAEAKNAQLAEAGLHEDRTEIVCGVDPFADKSPFSPGFPVYSSFEAVPADCPIDVIIDFSHFSLTRALLGFARARKLPLVLCTTAISPDDLALAAEAAKEIPVFRSANMSVGIALLKKLVRESEAFLGDDFDVEIVEKHHNRKVDAPSGTALALADAVSSAHEGGFDYVYDRSTRREKRSKRELGISAVRGGNIVGDHSVMFISDNEIIELSHSALSRSVFADGSLRAAAFLKDKAPGMYGMDDMV